MLVVGLGNPGFEYKKTRHNVGFLALDYIAEKMKAKFESYPKFHLAQFSLNGYIHYLMKPMTYMNLSGEAVKFFVENQNVLSTEILVIVDDVNLPVGRVKLKPSGSEGGHNGLRSIIGVIGTNFWRLRIGVGKPISENNNIKLNLADYVLSDIPESDFEIIKRIFNDLPEIISLWILGFGATVMSKINGKDYSSS